MRGTRGWLDPPLNSDGNGAAGGSSRGGAVAERKDEEASGAQLSRDPCAGQGGGGGQAHLGGRDGSFQLA